MQPAIELPPDVREIISVLNANGFEAYAVGGCVRDSIMGKHPADWDITTEAAPAHVKRLFARTHDTGIAHGTVTVVLNNKNYEVTTYRVDGEYLDNRRPASISFAGSLHEDLLRRDFTMNAIGYHDREGYVDPYGGMADISAGLVRGVGDAAVRFQEDALRMLRAIRFAAQLGFEIEQSTWAALAANAHLIENISMERVRDEVLKLLLSDDPQKLRMLCTSGIMAHIDPELAAHIARVCTDTFARVEKDAVMRLSILLRGLRTPRENIPRLRRFKIDNKTASTVITLLTGLETPIADDFVHIRERLADIGPECFSMLVRLFAAYGHDMRGVEEKRDIILEQKHCIRLRELAINGDRLKELGLTSGPEIGRELRRLFAHVLKHPWDNTPQALERLLAAGDYFQPADKS